MKPIVKGCMLAGQGASGAAAAGRCLGAPLSKAHREWSACIMCARLGERVSVCGALSIILRWCAARALWVADGHFLGGTTAAKHALCKICSCPRRRAPCASVCYAVSPPLALCAEWGINPRPLSTRNPSKKQLSRRDLLWLPPEMDARALNLEKWERDASTRVNNCPGFNRPYAGNLISRA